MAKDEKDPAENAENEIKNQVEETTAAAEEKAEEVVEAAEEATEEVVAEAEKAKEAVVEAAEEASMEIPKEAAPEAEEPVDFPVQAHVIVDPSDFDWSSVEQEEEEYSPSERERYDKIYDDTLTSIAEKEVIEGTVVTVTKKEVVINIGYKSEGVVPASEFRYNPELASGDKVPVYIDKQEDKNGQLIISHKTARLHDAWNRVNVSLDKGEIITGEVKCRTKGGLIIDVFGLEAFLPGSQIDVKPIRDYDQYVGKQMEFKVVKINHEFKNVVVSHKALIEAELEEQKKQIIGGLEKGQVLEGIVKNITSYGVFVDLGGVDGLIHITDLSWGRINHPEELVELDQKINVVILDFDDNKKRIALGLKQLSSHPWDALDEKLAVGDKVEGTVVVLADYGAFVEIAPGVEGLIHVSEMSWSQHLRSAQDFLKVGDKIDAEILTLDREERKMSLGMKQLITDPWAGIETKYPVESKHKASVRNFTNFGVFVELEEGIDGLIHISDLSWSKKIKHPSEFCAIGDELEVVVLELDQENRRLSLGHKQLEENPWDVFETVFASGSTHTGTVIKKDGSQAIIALPYGVEGYCHTKHLKKEDGTMIEADEAAEFVVLEFNKNAKRINVSHLRTYEEAPAKAERKKTTGGSGGGSGRTSQAVKNVNDQVEKATLGDFGVLSELKDKMASAEETPKAAKKAAKEEVAEEKPKAKKATKKAEDKAEEVAEEKPKAKKTAKAKKEEEGEADAEESTEA